MDPNGSDVSALLGLDGFVVRAQVLDEVTGEWWLAVETTESRGWCPGCGVEAVGHGRRRVKIRDRCDPLMVPDTGQGGQQAACSKEDMQRWEDDPGSLRRRSATLCWRC
jgi:hypothetical protein